MSKRFKLMTISMVLIGVLAVTFAGAALAADPQASNDPWMAIVSERIVPYAVAETAFPFDINIAFGNALERIYLQDADIKESFEIAHQEIQDVIENQGIAGTNPAMQ